VREKKRRRRVRKEISVGRPLKQWTGFPTTDKR
jgi:hypothetical protein